MSLIGGLSGDERRSLQLAYDAMRDQGKTHSQAINGATSYTGITGRKARKYLQKVKGRSKPRRKSGKVKRYQDDSAKRNNGIVNPPKF